MSCGLIYFHTHPQARQKKKKVLYFAVVWMSSELKEREFVHSPPSLKHTGAVVQ